MRQEILPLVLNELNELYKLQMHVATKIESNWGTQNLNSFFNKILIKDRFERNGFDINSYTHIFKLYLIHQSEYGFHINNKFINPNINLEEKSNTH